MPPSRAVGMTARFGSGAVVISTRPAVTGGRAIAADDVARGLSAQRPAPLHQTLQDVAVTDVNARAEQEHFKIKRFAVLYKLLDTDDGELTKTGKIRRKFVMEKYKDLYDALYDESVSKKKVEAFFQYQDGQSTTVEAEMQFYTMEGV